MTEPSPNLADVQLELLKSVRDDLPLYGALDTDLRSVADSLIELGLTVCARDGDLIITGKGQDAIGSAESIPNEQGDGS